MAFNFSQEKFFGYPLQSGGVSFGKINAQNANAFFLLNNSSLLSGSISYLTISITVQSIKVSDVPFEKPTLTNFGTQTFNFRGKNWTVFAVDYGGIYNIGSEPCYRNYTVQAVELNNPEFSLS